MMGGIANLLDFKKKSNKANTHTQKHTHTQQDTKHNQTHTYNTKQKQNR